MAETANLPERLRLFGLEAATHYNGWDVMKLVCEARERILFLEAQLAITKEVICETLAIEVSEDTD